jgi:glutathione S-transferase
MKLYYTPQSRADRPRWMLEELEIPYQLQRIDLKAGEQRTEEFRKINPMARVPVLVDGDLTLTESAAICFYLAEKFPQAGLRSAQLADYYRWSCYVYGSLEGPLIEHFLYKTPHLEQVWGARFQVLEDLPGPYICGAEFSAADVLMGSVLNWARLVGALEKFPRLLDYLQRLQARPAYQRAHQEAK